MLDVIMIDGTVLQKKAGNDRFHEVCEMLHEMIDALPYSRHYVNATPKCSNGHGLDVATASPDEMLDLGCRGMDDKTGYLCQDLQMVQHADEEVGETEHIGMLGDKVGEFIGAMWQGDLNLDKELRHGPGLEVGTLSDAVNKMLDCTEETGHLRAMYIPSYVMTVTHTRSTVLT